MDAVFQLPCSGANLHLVRYDELKMILSSNTMSAIYFLNDNNNDLFRESWAMEARLEPFVHYIPIRHDMSNVEEMIDWAENHPEQARLIAERSTLFVYDLLFHPDAIEDERLIMEGIMEAYENNFGHGIIEKGGTDQNYYLLSDDQSNRSERFPYVDERVEYYMGKWNDGQKTISMNRNNIDQLKELFPAHGVTADNSFIAFGSDLSRCAHHNSSDAVTIQLYCKSALPHFNEGNTADLKSNSFKRLLKTSVGSKMTFADRSCEYIMCDILFNTCRCWSKPHLHIRV